LGFEKNLGEFRGNSREKKFERKFGEFGRIGGNLKRRFVRNYKSTKLGRLGLENRSLPF
jgi:hypothetical protein